MSASFSWKINRSQTPTMSWEPDETATVDGDQLTPGRFWGWVDMCRDDDDFGISDDESRAHETADSASDSADERHHFELDPTRVFDQEEMLGHGQLGSVAKMKIRGSDIVFACKTSTTPYRVRKLRKEAKLLKNLDHEHIVKFIGTFTLPGKKHYLSLIMFPVGEQNLEEFLRDTESSEHLGWLKGWFFCLASALRYLHNKGVRHEDIKPSNIIHRGDKVLFTDFGSSTEFKSEMTTSTESPADGSPMYEAPEVLDRTKMHGARSDIFSLGCVYVELLTAIAKGHVHELHSFCKEHSPDSKKPSGLFLYSSVVDHLDLWFARLRPSIEITIIWKDIVQLMLRENRKERPTAIQTLELLKAGFIPLVLANDRDCCNQKGWGEIVSENLPLDQNLDQIVREIRHSIQQVGSVDGNLHRLEQLTLLIRMGCSDVTPDQQTLPMTQGFVENCFVNTFLIQESSSESKNLLRVMFHYRLDPNSRGRKFLKSPACPTIEPDIDAEDLDPFPSSNLPLRPMSSMLHAAAWWGHEHSVRILLENGADPNAGTEKEGTALHVAAWRGDLRTIKALLHAGADPGADCGIFATVLCTAAMKGHVEIVKALLDAGADTNQESRTGYAPITRAIDMQQVTIVRMLLDAGANPNCKGKPGNSATVVQRAAAWGDVDIVRDLLQFGADPNAEGGKYGTALIAAVSYGNSPSVIRVLCEGGAKLDAMDQNDGIALTAACLKGALEPVRMLIQLGADVNINTGIHGTAHAVASKRGHQEIVQLLEGAGARSTA